MEVTFTRTHQRRYRVSVEGKHVVPSYMDPAPGYDARMPHDMAHFIVENELGIKGGVFGQLANGGTAGTFIPIDVDKQRKFRRRGKRIATQNHKDAALSERLVFTAGQIWQKKAEASSFEGFAAKDIARVVREFESASAVWSKLGVGESMTLVWRVPRRNGRRPLR